MVAILKHVGIADWDRERLKMSVNTPSSWAVHALRTPGPAAVRGVTRVNLSLTLATHKERG